MSRGSLVLAAFALAAFAAVPGQATVYNLTVDNCTGGCNPGGAGNVMGTVTVTGSGTTTLTVTVSLENPLEFVNTGLQETIDFNLSGTPTLSGFSTTNSNFGLSSTTAGSFHFDGLGNFQYAVQLNTGQGAGGAVASPETFSFTCSAACQEVVNGNGFFFGVDVYNTVNKNTGPIGTNGGTPTTPEPTSIAFFGTGLIGLGVILRRKFARS